MKSSHIVSLSLLFGVAACNHGAESDHEEGDDGGSIRHDSGDGGADGDDAPIGEHLFPRVGGYVIGGGTTGDLTYASATDRDVIARWKVVILGGAIDHFYEGRPLDRQQTYDDIKARSHALGTDIRIVQYMNYNELPLAREHNWFTGWWDTVNANNLWDYNSGASGDVARSGWDASWALINVTHYVPPVAGLYPYELAAAHANDFLFVGGAGSWNVATSIDGVFLDNLFWYGQGDLSRGASTDFATISHEFRAGEGDFMTKLRELSGRKTGGNITQLTSATHYPWTDHDAIAPLWGVNELGVLEYAIGENGGPTVPYGAEHYDGTLVWLARYQYAMESLSGPRWLVVEHIGLEPNGTDHAGGVPYQSFRYGFGITTMGDGYYAYDQNYAHQTPTFEFDEMFGGALDDRNWLGAAIDPPQTTPWNGTVLRRRFEHGAVFVNTRGSADQVIDLSGYARLSGSQAPGVNNGSTGGTYTLAGGDALFVQTAM